MSWVCDFGSGPLPRKPPALGTLEKQGADFFTDHFIRKKLNYADQYQYNDGPQHR